MNPPIAYHSFTVLPPSHPLFGNARRKLLIEITTRVLTPFNLEIKNSLQLVWEVYASPSLHLNEGRAAAILPWRTADDLFEGFAEGAFG
jgi:hypothetical protein